MSEIKGNELKNRAKEAPNSPGVYLWHDDTDEVIYVGKAKSLHARLSQYFLPKRDIKTKHLVEHAKTIEWILTDTEYDALLLENNLIKKYSPKYNIMLKDGKTYPSIRITNEDWPRVFRTRYIVNDGSRYFGPYPEISQIDDYIELIKKLFPLRRCKNFKTRQSPCMYHHIGRCPSPCTGSITKEEYAKNIDKIASLLSGHSKMLAKEIKKEMETASQELKFERAAFLRDSLIALENFQSRNNLVDFVEGDRDYVAWYFDGTLVDFVVFQTRSGKLTGRDLFRERYYGTEIEAISQFLVAYYTKDRLPPPEIFVSDNTELEIVYEYLEKELNIKFKLKKPNEKKHQAALAMAVFNAREDIVKRRKEKGDIEAMEYLRNALSLPTLPELIEGFDIAQLSGKHTVASLISFKNGIANKKAYRIFKIKSLEGAIDDFGAMREVCARHYSSVANGESEIPNMVLIDGGRGQVNAAWEVINALGLDIPVVGLAKENEELWPHGASSPIVLPKDSPGLRLVVAVRDETHRFATKMNQNLRGKDVSFTILESTKGIGRKKASKIMDDFGSLQAVAEAEPEYIAKKVGIPIESAKELKKNAQYSVLKNK